MFSGEFWFLLSYLKRNSLHWRVLLQAWWSEDNTTRPFLLLHLQRRPGGGFEHFSNAILGFGWAFQVAESVDLVSHVTTFFRSNRLLLHLHQLSLRIFIISQIAFVAHQNDGHVRTEMLHFRRPFLGNVLQAVRTVNTEAHQDNVGIWIRQWTKSVVVFLTSGIPKSQLNLMKRIREWLNI